MSQHTRFWYLPTRNYRLSKEVVHELKFGAVAVMLTNNLQYSDRHFNTDGSLRCLKEAKTMDMILGINVNFKIVFLIFSNICCRYTFELPHRGNSNVSLQHYVFSINELFTISVLKTDSQLFSLFQ